MDLPAGRLLGLASGSETGWDTGCAWVSELVLEALLGSLQRQRDPGLEGLNRALEAAARALTAHPKAPAPDPDFSPGATLIVAYLSPAHAEIGWVGAERAILIRGGTLAEATRPHSLREMLLERGDPIPEGTVIPPVVTRFLSPQGVQGGAAGRARWALEPGDRVLLLSKSLGEGDLDELARRASGGDIEEALWRVSRSLTPRFPRAVAAALAGV